MGVERPTMEEIGRLRADIDFERLLITLRGSTTKSGKTRFVPIPTERLRAVLGVVATRCGGREETRRGARVQQ